VGLDRVFQRHRIRRKTQRHFGRFQHRRYTCAITVAEVISKTAREGRDVEAAYDMLLSNSQIIKVDEQISKQAGLIHVKMRQTAKDFGIADALILATANKLEAKIVTGDPHFKGLKNAVLIK
jgi:predicted nucleic acid-binding protein